MKICTFLGLYFFSEISFQVQFTGRIGKSWLGRRLGFDLKQCLFDIIDRFPNNETRIMIHITKVSNLSNRLQINSSVKVCSPIDIRFPTNNFLFHQSILTSNNV